MRFADDDVMTLLYSDRQLIVVDSDEAVALVRQAENESSENAAGTESGGVGAGAGVGAVVAAGALPVAGAAAVLTAALLLWKQRKRVDKAKLPILVVSTTQASGLRFPNGHPLKNVVYVGDPGIAGNYYPVSSFHRFLFEGKVAEALRLLRSLGATEISIEYLEGFDRAAGVDLSVAVTGDKAVDAGGSAGRAKKSNSTSKTTMQLSPTLPPQIPNDLVWFRSEPLWQEVAHARLESGLRAFSIDVNYTEDFGINGKLKAKIAGVGLELGGRFTEYQETVWKLRGTFAE